MGISIAIVLIIMLLLLLVRVLHRSPAGTRCGRVPFFSVDDQRIHSVVLYEGDADRRCGLYTKV